MLRRLGSAPVRGENYARAEIIVGQRQPSKDLKERHPELVGPIPNPVPAPHRTPRETAETYTRAFEGILARENSRG